MFQKEKTILIQANLISKSTLTLPLNFRSTSDQLQLNSPQPYLNRNLT